GQSKGLKGSDGSPRRCAPRDDRRGEGFMASITQAPLDPAPSNEHTLSLGELDRRRFAPVIHHTFVIAKEACRLRQSKGLKGSDGSAGRRAAREDRRGGGVMASITQASLDRAPSNEHTMSLGEVDLRRLAAGLYPAT